MDARDLQAGFRLGQWAVYPRLGHLTDGGDGCHVEPKIMDVLVLLASRSGDVVLRDEIVNSVWDGRPMADDALSRCITELRKLLGDDAREPKYIATVPKRGYRLLIEVTPVEDVSPVNEPGGSVRKHNRRWLVAIFAAIAMSVMFFAMQQRTMLPPPSPAADGKHTIAVLPFKLRSELVEDAYIADGLHDDLLTHLAGIDAWHVISRTSVERFRNLSESVDSISSQLNASLILEGGLQRNGDNMRFNIQLIDAASDTHLWAKTYDYALGDNPLKVQNMFVSSVTRELAVFLDADDNTIVATPTESFIAYREFIKGRRLTQVESIVALNAAVEHFKDAIEKDPGYAEAHAALADAYLSLGIYFFGGMTWDDAVAVAEPVIVRAIELDPSLAHAYAADGLLQMMSGDPIAAEAALERALALRPSFPRAYRLYGNLRWRQGRFDEAIELTEFAASLSPLSGPICLELGRYYDHVGRYDEAMDRYVTAANLMPDNALARAYLAALHYLVKGQVADSLIWYHEAALLDPDSPAMQALPALAYLEIGNIDMAAKFVAKGMAIAADDFWPRYAQMLLELAGGNSEAAYADAEVLLENFPLSPDALRTLRDRDLASGNAALAEARYAKAHPEIAVSMDPTINSRNLFAAVDFARVLIELGKREQADLLLESALEVTHGLRRKGTNGYWLADIAALAMLGRGDEAVQRLDLAIGDGQSPRTWYHLYMDPGFDALWINPDFVAVRERSAALLRAEAERAIKLRATLSLDR